MLDVDMGFPLWVSPFDAFLHFSHGIGQLFAVAKASQTGKGNHDYVERRHNKSQLEIFITKQSR